MQHEGVCIGGRPSRRNYRLELLTRLLGTLKVSLILVGIPRDWLEDAVDARGSAAGSTYTGIMHESPRHERKHNAGDIAPRPIKCKTRLATQRQCTLLGEKSIRALEVTCIGVALANEKPQELVETADGVARVS
ncbi:hypothetical protein PsYK624_155870 [Phanerochaete sordida]|uniref:Uncharacterized protein n=1 Tax=Phanerochaete sordida TaxID=48140 RepID=A0A9P3GP53_9APHY|nr:hypothetical protein PsYK624_155870 [Phanerochaete sordida]